MDGEVISAELIQKIGIDVENITPETASRLGYNGLSDGIAISRVKPGSPAAQAGLRPGLLITGVAVTWNNQKAVKDMTEFEEALKEIGDKKHLILLIRHQNFQRYYTIKIK
jgi:serine protease Do